MERDLKKLRAKRAEREKAAGLLTRPAGVTKDRSTPITPNKSPPVDGKDAVEKSEEAEPILNAQPVDGIKTDGDIVLHASNPDDQNAVQTEPVITNVIDAGSPQATAITTQPLDLDPSVGLAIDLQPELQASIQPEPASKPQDPSTKMLNEPPLNPPEDLQPVNHQEAAPFESMFTDLENPSNPTSLDFDLSFPSTGPDLLNDTAFDNIVDSTSNDNQSLNLPPATAEDIDSLLPGLDSYVHNGGDFSMLDMNIPATTTVPDVSTAAADTTVPALAPNITSEGEQGHQMDSAPMESSFDDLFGGSGDWGMDDDMGGGTMGDFDESWFKTDG